MARSNRAALARLIFADRVARADLEAIVHPDVYRRIRDWFAQLPLHHGGRRSPIFRCCSKRGMVHDFDAVIVAACSPEEQLRRLMTRDGLTEADARARLGRAVSHRREGPTCAPYVIRTDGDYAETDAEIGDVRELRYEAGC